MDKPRFTQRKEYARRLRAVSEDAAAAERLADEHNERVAELFTDHNRALLRFLKCWLHSTHEAKEVAQEAYVRMLQLDTPNGISYLRAYLFKTAANLAADRIKTARRREDLDQLRFFEPEECQPSPEAAVSAEQEIAAVLKMCEQLPARCRYAFIMHRFHGHSIPEVAVLMNVSVRMVQIYVERAIVFCRDQMKSTMDNGGTHAGAR
jgi:RNA polymerase sigma factor (sigma-70 family)